MRARNGKAERIGGRCIEPMLRLAVDKLPLSTFRSLIFQSGQ